jgi:hypothetical protein
MPQAKRVFVTSTRHDGDLNDELPAGGLAGGDAICQARADAALRGGTWTAWLSAPGVSAASRITDSAYVWIDGRTLIVASLADLTDNALINPISQDEQGRPRADHVWTGATPDGAGAAWSMRFPLELLYCISTLLF